MIRRNLTRRFFVGYLFLHVWNIACACKATQSVAFVKPLRAGKGTLPAASFQIQSTTIEVQDPGSILSLEEASELNDLVTQRSRARWDGNYTHADMVREQIQDFSLPNGYQVMVQDVPRKSGGESTWKLVYLQELPSIMEGPTVLQLAHAALGLAVEESVQTNLGRAHAVFGIRESVDSVDVENQRKKQLQAIVQQAKARLNNSTSVQYELAGRKAADTAFWFALAGVSDPQIFQALVEIATREIQRFGARPSCRPKDVYQVLERFAAAGIQKAPELEEVARKCLRLKASTMEGTTNSASGPDSLLDFHSDRSLLLIWKFSTKQKKQRAFLQSALKHWQRHKETVGADEKSIALSKSEFTTQPQEYDWDTMFADPSLPLVVDIGCGMGVSLLGLSSSTDENITPASSQLLFGNHPSTTWHDCNFVGVDLGALGIGYARSVASRWCLEDRLQFVVDSAEDFVEKVKESYPGPIRVFLIQFPTPYRLKPAETNDINEKSGNSQLPTSAHDGFMVTENLLRLIHESLSKTNGRLLLQSNCEDVAVGMRNLACKKVGFSFESMSTNVESGPFTSVSVPPRVPQRTADWIAMGGERANGPGWFENPLLHREGATETEVACALNGTPVHRCVLRPSGNKKAE